MNEVKDSAVLPDLAHNDWLTMPHYDPTMATGRSQLTAARMRTADAYTYGCELRKQPPMPSAAFMQKYAEGPVQAAAELLKTANQAGSLRTVARLGSRLMAAAEALQGTREVLDAYRKDASTPASNYRNTMSKILGVTLGTASTGAAVTGAAALLATGVTVGTLGGAALILGAGTACAWGLYKASPWIVGRIESSARWLVS